MKKLIIILMMFFAFITLKAQSTVDTAQCKYAEIINLHGMPNVVITWAEGVQTTLLKQKTMLDALNFMSLKGWEFVSSYDTRFSQDILHHWIIRRK